MPPLTDEQQKNLEVAQRINRETRSNPDSAYAGKTIGVWHEEVVAVGETLDEVCKQLDELGDVGQEAVVIEASRDYEDKVMFWSPVFLSTKLFRRNSEETQ